MTTTTAPAPAPTTVRMFGKCAAKRCRTRVVVDVPAEADNRNGGQLAPTTEGMQMLHAAAHRALDAACAPGGVPRTEVIDGCSFWHDITWSGLRSRVVTGTPCGAKCATSTSPECKCACGGERHGEAAL